jgi:hypothetical protein
MDMKTKVKKYSEWYEIIDAMRGIESIPVSELLQMAFSAGVEAAEQSVHWTLPMCSVCGESVARKSGMCEDCEMLARQSQ